MESTLRPTLNDFSSIICLKAMITGMEDSLGEKATAIALTAAGRQRGKNLIKSLGLSQSNITLDELTSKLALALGENGTRLCIVEKIVQEEGNIKAFIREDICTSGEPQGSPRKCLFTLGAIWGALEESLGKRLQGKHTESVLDGKPHNVFEFMPLR